LEIWFGVNITRLCGRWEREREREREGTHDGEKGGAELGVALRGERRGGDVACAAVDYDAGLHFGGGGLLFVFHLGIHIWLVI
jgi:hypothetical protein